MTKQVFTQEEKNEWIPEEFYDLIHVFKMGATKYERDGWLHPEPEKAHFIHKNNCASMFRHLAESFARPYVSFLSEDKESKLDPDLHLAIRALMAYTRRKRNLPME